MDLKNEESSGGALLEADVRAMVRLLGQAAGLEGGHQEVKRFLMTGLCQLVEAQCWVWTLACQTTPGKAQSYVGYTHGGFDEERLTGYLAAIEHPDMAGAVEGFYRELEDRGGHTTMTSEEMDPTGRFQKSEGRFLWQEIDIGPVVLSSYPLDANSCTMVGLYREFGAEPFGERETQIVHTFLKAVPWLHGMGWPADRGVAVPKLQPRQRVVLNLLVEGLSRKAIAAQMGISENTVAGYARAVYRHFEVHSQVELLNHFLGNSETPAHP